MKKHLLQLPALFNFRREKKLNYYTIIFLSFFIVSVTSTLLLTVFLGIHFYNSISSSAKNYNKQLLAQTNYTIDQMQEEVEWLTDSLLNADTIIAYLSLTSTDNTNIPSLAGMEVNKHLRTLPYLDSIYLYNSGLNLIYSSKTGYQQSLSSFEDSDVAAHLTDKDFITMAPVEPVLSGDVFSFYVFNTHSANQSRKNAVIINVKTSILTEYISSMADFTDETESSFLLLDSDQNMLLSVLNRHMKEDGAWTNHALKSISSKDDLNSSYIKINGKTYFQTHTAKNVYGWNLFSFIPFRLLFQNIFMTILLSLLIWIAILIFTVMLCRHIAERLNKPVELLTQSLSGLHPNSTKDNPFETEEFRKISAAISSLQKNNEHLRSVQQKSHYSMIQTFLNGLLTKHHTDSPGLTAQNLKQFHLSYLEEDKLCMAVFKIDHYRNFIEEHTADEVWAIQFSVINIIEELASAEFRCNAFSPNNDKFILLVSSDTSDDLVDFEDRIVLLFQSVQNNIEHYLHFTMTAAYSKIFHGIDKFPAVYKTLEHSLLLKMHYGHHAIIDPYQIDEVPTEPFQISPKLSAQLISHLMNGQLEETWAAYERLSENLFVHDYMEIISAMTYFVHNIYEQLSAKYPMLKDTFTNALKPFISNLHDAEVSDDIQNISHEFLQTLCFAIQKLKAEPAQQSSAVTVNKIVQMLESQYPDPSLCLATIADEVGLSANYTGQIFKEYTQKSIAQYLLEIRMEKIAFYLRTTSLPLSKILGNVGMELNNYFYTRFRNYFGMSLSEYRQQVQAEKES